MSEPNPTEAFVAQLDRNLAAMADNASTLPDHQRTLAVTAANTTRTELREVHSAAQLAAVAGQYRNAPRTDPVTTALHAKLLASFDEHLRQHPTAAVTTKAVVPTEPTAATPQRPTVAEREATPLVAATGESATRATEVRHEAPPPTATTVQQPSTTTRPTETHSQQPAIQPGDLVVFRNGDQNRWGIVDHRPRDATFVLRVGGIPHAVPAVNITHTIDPRQQPDLPLDTVLDGERLRVRRVHWGDDAERLQALAKGRPAMQRLAHVTDGFDLRDGIGSNNERADPSTRRDAMAHDRSDQQPDVDFVRSNPGRSTRATPTPGVPVQRLPTAGPNAMGWSANLDNAPTGQTRIIVTGSRDLTPNAYDTIKATLQRELADLDPAKVTIVHGAAKGADRLAAQAARELGMRTEAHRADWDTHGKAAGPIRNQQMLDAGAQRVIAFVDKPLDQSRGTADMVGRARNAAIPATVVDTQTITAVPVAPTPAPPARAMR